MTDHIEPFHQPRMDYRYGIICIRELLQALHDIYEDDEFYRNNEDKLFKFEGDLYLMKDLFQERINKMPYESDNYNFDDSYYCWAKFDDNGKIVSGKVKWNMINDDFSMKTETEPKKKEKAPELLDFSINILKHYRTAKGYLTIGDVLDIFDLKYPRLRLFNGEDEINQYEIYCGDLDKYKKGMRELESLYLSKLAASENIDEIRDMVYEMNKIREAIDNLDDCEECND